MRAPPRMAGMMQTMIQAQRWERMRMPKPTIKVKKMETTPEGMFIKAARFGVYPKPRINVEE